MTKYNRVRKYLTSIWFFRVMNEPDIDVIVKDIVKLCTVRKMRRKL